MSDESAVQPINTVERAQADLNRAVARWARADGAGKGVQELLTAWSRYQTAVQAGFMATVKQDADDGEEDGTVAPESPPPAPKSPYFTGTPAPAGWAINTAHPRDPLAETARFPYDVATEARIANLLAVVNYPHPIPSGDLVRKAAVTRALAMLGLDTVPTT